MEVSDNIFIDNSQISFSSKMIQNVEYAILALLEDYYASPVVFYGASDTGKTSLLHQIQDAIASKYEAVTIYSILTRENVMGQLLDIFGMSSGNINLEIDMTAELVALGKRAKSNNTIIAFFIDDLDYMGYQELGDMMSALHRCNQLSLPVTMYCTGRPEILKTIGDCRPYGERLFRFIPME